MTYRPQLLFVLLLAAVLAMPAAAHARPLKMIWGPADLPNGQSAFPIYSELGVDVLQMDLRWATTAPSVPADATNPADPAYRWPSDIDAAVARAAGGQLQVALMVEGTPGWANGGHGPAWAPTKPAEYANFLVAAARRYPTVHFWMIWGEPTKPGRFRPMPANSRVGPRRYAALLDAAYQALKGTSAANMVIGGMTWTGGTVRPADFVRWMRLPSGLPPRLDYYGHNPYSARFPNIRANPYFRGGRDISDLDTFSREVNRAYKVRHVQPKLWLSEFSISSDHSNREFNFYVSQRDQARWLSAAYRLADRSRAVAGLGWFNLLDEPATARSVSTGLMTHSLRRKPAFAAYRRAR